jgi:septal ring factor EnvC (AmiA/AmiB activator)
MTITLQNLVSAAALLGVFFAYSQFKSQKREASVKEGVHKREHEQLTADLASAKARLDAIDHEVQSGKVDTAEIKTDIKHILAALKDIQKKLDRECT